MHLDILAGGFNLNWMELSPITTGINNLNGVFAQNYNPWANGGHGEFFDK